MQDTAPLDAVCARLTESLAQGNFVRLVLSSPVEQGDAPKKILGRFVMLKGAPHISLTYRYATRDVTKNVPTGSAVAWLREQLGQHFRSALVCTTARDWQFISSDTSARLVDHKPSAKKAPSAEHDQKHAGILDNSARDWLEGLGILDRDGKLRASMADKYRQINHYLEILSHLAKECGWTETSEGRVPGTLHLADMGCGKGYLTFGTWHLFHRVWKQPIQVLGVESRDDLVFTTNNLAKQIKADGLQFIRGSIENVKLTTADALIALHACNTATDDAIRRGIELRAKLIVVAPCCHKEIRPQLNKPEPLAGILGHGLMEERLAEWLTDGLRAQFLEWAGYRTKIMEFVSTEHTPKNLLIVAVREREPFVDVDARKRIEALKNHFGIQHHALDVLLK